MESQELKDLKKVIKDLESKGYTIMAMAERIGVAKYIIDDLQRKKPRAVGNYIPVIQKLTILRDAPDIEFTVDKYVDIQQQLTDIQQ